MIDKDIFKVASLRIRVTSFAAPEVLNLLDRTVLGNRGGMQYSLTRVRERINSYKEDLRFISVYRHDHIMGTLGVCCRKTSTAGIEYGTAYLRYMAVEHLYQSPDEGNLEERFAKRRKKSSVLKEKLIDVYRNPTLIEAPGSENDQRYVLYAFVESKNERSKNIVIQSGFDHLRSFITIGFSRFNPVADDKVVPLKESEREEIEPILKEAFKGYSFFSLDNLFMDGQYYIIREKGEIVAGMKAVHSEYRIVNVPGIGGWILRTVLPFIPLFNRLVTKNSFRFLVFDTIYVKEGEESLLEPLFETALAREGFNSALIMLDQDGPLAGKIRKSVKLGAVGKLLNLRPNYVYGRFVNVPESEKANFFSSPVYMSGVDFT